MNEYVNKCPSQTETKDYNPATTVRTGNASWGDTTDLAQANLAYGSEWPKRKSNLLTGARNRTEADRDAVDLAFSTKQGAMRRMLKSTDKRLR
jgi:hypothetical protein